MEEIVKRLTEKNLTIATMESCTGGALANAITNIEGSSLVFKFGAVTYSNEYKIKMGVDSNIINKFSVYSIETAEEMSKNIATFTHSDIGIGVTGKINREDVNNKYGEDNKIFVSIFINKKNQFLNFSLIVNQSLNREENKKIIVNRIIDELKKLLDISD